MLTSATSSRTKFASGKRFWRTRAGACNTDVGQQNATAEVFCGESRRSATNNLWPQESKTVPKRKPVEPTFTVVPETVELRPRTMCQFTFRGLWKTPADITELLVLEAKIGKVTQDAFECNVKGNSSIRCSSPPAMLSASTTPIRPKKATTCQKCSRSCLR